MGNDIQYCFHEIQHTVHTSIEYSATIGVTIRQYCIPYNIIFTLSTISSTELHSTIITFIDENKMQNAILENYNDSSPASPSKVIKHFLHP
jgi:hypothetical protein